MWGKLRKNQQGLAHIAMVVLVILVLVAIGLVGWKVATSRKTSTNSSSSSSTTSSTSSSASTSSCMAQYHDNRICSFATSANSFSKTAYTATLTITQSGATSSATLENDGKGNTELSTTGNGSTLNSITLNGKTYIQSGGTGTWIEYSTGSSAPTTNPTSDMNIGVGSTGISFKYITTESCGSLNCYKYQVTDSATPSSTQYVWFDTSAYKLRQWQATDASGNTTLMTISYTSVNITTPSPVQQFSASQ